MESGRVFTVSAGGRAVSGRTLGTRGCVGPGGGGEGAGAAAVAGGGGRATGDAGGGAAGARRGGGAGRAAPAPPPPPPPARLLGGALPRREPVQRLDRREGVHVQALQLREQRMRAEEAELRGVGLQREPTVGHMM